MRLTSFAFKRFWDVHAWAGVITGLLVYVMFVLGAFVLFYRPGATTPAVGRGERTPAHQAGGRAGGSQRRGGEPGAAQAARAQRVE